MKTLRNAAKGNWGLTLKQESFAHEYLKNGGNATQAYLTVFQGSPKTASSAGAQMVKKEEVQKYIMYLREEIKNEKLVSLEEIINNVKKIESECRNLKKFDTSLDANKFLATLMGFDKKNDPSAISSSNPIQINILPPPSQNNKSIDIT